MEINYNTTEMRSFENMLLEDIEMDIEISRVKDQESSVRVRPAIQPADIIPKKKRRTNTKVSRGAVQKFPKSQDLGPPMLTGFGDTIVVSNPFDDAPPKTSQNWTMNMENGMGRKMHSYRLNCSMVRDTSPILPEMKIMSPVKSQNIRNTRPKVNKMNSMTNCPINEIPMNFLSPINHMGENLSNENHQLRIGRMTEHEMASAGNHWNKMAVNNNNNNKILDGRLPTNNINGKMKLDRPSYLPLHVNNENHTENEKWLRNMSNASDVGHVEQLMHKNMNISQETRNLGFSFGAPESLSNKKGKVSSIGYSGSRNSNVKHSNLQKALSMRTKLQLNEKLYPADQPMIFNPQNPHAPPIYPCGICRKEVTENDQGIICESGCNFWFHRSCLGLSEAAFQLLTQEIYAEWACDNCLRWKNIPVIKFKS